MISEVLKIGSKITVLPIVHGSADFALTVRREMLCASYDCLAVPLPPSFQESVERAIELLPTVTLVTQAEVAPYQPSWSPDENDESNDEKSLSYVPIDPCQGVIAALRCAMGEHLSRAFIDLETRVFQPCSTVFPDPFALKKVPLYRFAAALLPYLPPPGEGQPLDRVHHMATRLRELEKHYKAILLVCSVTDWPWIRDAYMKQTPCTVDHEGVEETVSYEVDRQTSIFMLGELPFITGLYEQAREQLDDDENLTLDGVKELLIEARQSYRSDLKHRARKITPHLLSQCLKYIRNLSLLESRMTPDLYTIVIAAKQVAGDQFALHVAETAREYRYYQNTGLDSIKLGIDRGRLPTGDLVSLVNRLPGQPISWRSCKLNRRPDRSEVKKWQMQWDPFSQCSWPPEDELIENFRTHVFDRARAIMGADLAHTEKFTTSIKDGIDIRDTLRHWYEKEVYVKVLPPDRGNLDCVVMLFDCPADPRDYPWRATWFAEHENESTMAFFGSDFHQELVGPGIALSTYGGSLFLFPPISIPDVWSDPRLDFTETMEERLLAAACLHSRDRHIALLSPAPPGAGWRRLAKRYQKKWVHIPLGKFSDSTIQQLRMVHVLNGKEVRSYASHYIRRA